MALKHPFYRAFLLFMAFRPSFPKPKTRCGAIRNSQLQTISTAVEAYLRSGQWIPNSWVFPWYCWRYSRKIFGVCPDRHDPRPLRWHGGWPAPRGWGWSGRSLPPGGRAPWWWHSCPWRATEGLLDKIFCEMLYCFLSCPLHYWFVGLVIMITKSNFFVKFQCNKHLKKDFWEQNTIYSGGKQVYRSKSKRKQN